MKRIKPTLLPWWIRWLARWSEKPLCRAHYKDGQWSRPLCYREAESLAAIFGGEVRWADEFEEAEF